MKENSLLNKITKKINYEIELVTQLILIFAISIDFGIMESLYINTEVLNLSIAGHWSWYHVGLTLLIIITSFSASLLHIQWLLRDRKKYMLLMGIASIPLGLMIEDITWFVARLQPIAKDEWTMIYPGLGIPLGFTWVPLWYFVVTVFSTLMFIWAGKYAKKGYQEYLNKKSKFE